MSLILDALRKSDDERNRQQAPSIAGGPTAQTSSPATPRWIWPVLALLIVNMLILLWVLTGRDDVTPAVSAPTTKPDRAAVVVPQEPTVPAPRRTEVRSLLAETISEVRESREETPEPAQINAPPASTDAAAARAADDTTSSVSAPTSNPATAPTLPVYDPGRATEWQWPGLTLELLVYNEQSASRFGFINGQKVNEGGRLSEGPTITEIRRDGIILEYRSRRLLLRP